MPRMPLEPLRRRAADLGIADRVRLVPRFVADAEIPAYFRRADLVALPYRDTEQSGVLDTALAFGSPLVLSSVGGFTEVAERAGAARLVPPGDPVALGAALTELLADEPARAGALADAARARRRRAVLVGPGGRADRGALPASCWSGRREDAACGRLLGVARR